MHGGSPLSRRRLLATVGLTTTAGFTAAGASLAAPAAHAAPRAGSWTRRRSQNGWSIPDAPLRTYKIEGSDASIVLRAGAPATVLLHVLRRFHYEIDSLGAGDVHGHRADRTVAAAYESNYLSGTAVAIRANAYPIGAAGNVFSRDLIIIRDILAECEGTVRWGGDDPHQAKEGHFQIDVPPDATGLRRVAARIRGWRNGPGQGAGTPIEITAPTRRSAALALARRQRKAQ